LGVPGQVGSTGRLHYLEGNQRYVMEDQLLEVQPYRRYLSRVTGDALVAEVETILTPSEHGTDVAVRWTGVGRSRLSRLMLPFMRRSIARQAQRDLEKLKRLVEGGAEATA
jgi:hypothetical protein